MRFSPWILGSHKRNISGISGEIEVKNISTNQRPGQLSWILNISKKNKQNFFKTSRGTFLASLLTSHAVVLEKKSKISRPIRGQDSHLRFLIASKRTFLKDPRGTIMIILVVGHSGSEEVENGKYLQHMDIC